MHSIYPLNATQPIGIFDSGVGGLTVAHAIKQRLPHEKLIYYADTLHFPYGEKSAVEIQEFALKIVNWFAQQECKLIVIACNSASVAATEFLQDLFQDYFQIVNVIDPILNSIAIQFAGKSLGIIGTTQTICSGVYQRKIEHLNANIQVQALATPLLAPAIEDQLEEEPFSLLIKRYLDDPVLTGIEGLILGCSHYPLIKARLAQHYQNGIPLVDPSELIATHVADYLAQAKLLHPATQTPKAHARYQYYLSQAQDQFIQSATQFFEEFQPFQLNASVIGK